MHIYFLDAKPYLSAHYLCDEFLAPAIETVAEILYEVHMGREADESGGYLHIEEWVRTRRPNYVWKYKYFQALCREGTMRFRKVHPLWHEFGIPFSIPPNSIPGGKCCTRLGGCKSIGGDGPQYGGRCVAGIRDFPVGDVIPGIRGEGQIGGNARIPEAVEIYRGYFLNGGVIQYNWTIRGMPTWGMSG